MSRMFQASMAGRKKLLHLNGGKTSSEINTFKDFLSSLVPGVENGTLGGIGNTFC
jgi:hypothetical protein